MIASKRNALILGPIGIGKTTLVKAATQDIQAVVWAFGLSPFKEALLEIVQGLSRIGRLAPEEAKNLAKMPVPALSRALSRSLGNCILVLDRLEQATPSMAPHLEQLMADSVIIGIATELPVSRKLTRVWWRFSKKIHLQPLSSEESRELFWRRLHRHVVPNPDDWDKAVLSRCGGNPLAIVELSKQAEVSPSPTIAAEHPAGRREIDLTPGLLLLGAVVIAARFVALGLNDVDTYILAGAGGAFFVVARYFIYRLLRGRNAA